MSSTPSHVLVAGGGIGGLETILALRAHAGYRVLITLLSPDPEFHVRALSVEDPFGRAPVRHYDVGRICAEVDAEFAQDGLAAVDAGARIVTTTGGRAVAYDDLVVAVGARRSAPFSSGLVFGGLQDAEAMHGLVQDVELGTVDSIVFAVPPGTAWPLPLYELALLTAERAFAMGVEIDLTFLTPEDRPLGAFGAEAAETVERLLRESHVTLRTATHVRDLRSGAAIGVDGSTIVQARRAVTIPVLHGPRIAGLPADPDGFLPVDARGALLGAEHAWAVGDATTVPLKQGGLAAQQAGSVAAAVAAEHGAEVSPEVHHPVLRAKLFTGHRPEHLGDVTADDDAKVATTYLAPLLTRLDWRSEV